MNISVVGGTGYVGLTTAVCLAAKNHHVYCVGRNEKKIEQLRAGMAIIFEDGLQEILRRSIKSGNFVPSTNLRDAVQNSQIIFISVGTPSREDGSSDLSQIQVVSRQIGEVLRDVSDYRVVVVKSTVVPGTTEGLVVPLLEKFSGKKVGTDFGVCMNPEFLREGQAIKDFLYPKEQSIVIGEYDCRSGDLLFDVYAGFEAAILRTTINAAEMIKYARNSYLAKDISFANEIANLCQRFGVDYLEVKKGMEMDARIGEGRFLDAGAGFGGSCFPKDVKAIVSKAKESGIVPRMLEATLKVNEAQPLELIKLAKEVLDVKGKRVCVLGLAFKPGTDDMREASSVKVVGGLLAEGCEVCVYDPKAEGNAKRIFGEHVEYAEEAETALHDSDVCIIVTEWPEFSNPELYTVMKGRVIIDGRRSLDFKRLPAGFVYHAIGFPKAVKT